MSSLRCCGNPGCLLFAYDTYIPTCSVTNDRLESRKSSLYDVLYVVLLWYIPYLNPTISRFARRVVAASQKRAFYPQGTIILVTCFEAICTGTVKDLVTRYSPQLFSLGRSNETSARIT
jgi:hypothetical protein